MTDAVYINGDKPAKKIEQIMRTENTEAALKAFQNCVADAASYGDDYKDDLAKLRNTLKTDGALDLLSLQWANDHKDLFSGLKNIKRDDVTKAISNARLASGDNGSYNPDMNASAILANNLILQIDTKNGFNVSEFDAAENAQRNNFVGKGGGVKLNDLAYAAKILLDDGANKAKLFGKLSENNCVDDVALQKFIDDASKPNSTFLQSLGYTPQQGADAVKAVKTLLDHYDDLTGILGDSFNSTDLAKAIGFAGAADMMTTFRQMDANDAQKLSAKKPEVSSTKPTVAGKDHHPGTTGNPKDAERVPSKDPHKDQHTTKVSAHSAAKASQNKLLPIPKVELGEGYYQVAARWLKEAHVDASEAQLLALTHSLVKANNHRTELRVGEILKFDPSDPAFTVMTKTNTPTS